MDPRIIVNSEKNEKNEDDLIVFQNTANPKDPLIETQDVPNVNNVIPPKNEPVRSRRGWKFWVLVVGVPILVIVSIGGGLWGYSSYEKIHKVVNVDLLLPKEVDFAAHLAIDTNAPQIELVEKNIKKFPGYEFFRKQMDKVGEGKDASDSLVEKWKSVGVDFDEDIKPALGSVAYLVLPDIQPLQKLIGKELSQLHLSNATQYAMGNPLDNAQNGEVLGWSTANADEDANSDNSAVLDFIMTAEIKDLEKAKKALSKVSGENFETTHLKYKGYDYVKISDKKKAKSSDGSSTPVSLKMDETYHVALGMNWVVTSKESWVHEMIDRRSAQSFLSFSDKKESLADNKNYVEIMRRLKSNEDHIVSAYYRWNSRQNCGGEVDLCKYLKDMGVYEAGFLLGAKEDGFIIQTATINDMIQVKQKPNGYASGLSDLVAKNSAGLWADVFIEVSDFKMSYYDVKRNLITDEGLDEWNKLLDSLMLQTGVHIERDIIDHLNGNAALFAFTGKNKKPAILEVLDVDDTASFTRLLQKFVDEANRNTQKTTAWMPKNSENQGGVSGLPLDPALGTPLVIREEKNDAGTIYALDQQGFFMGAMERDQKKILLGSSIDIIKEIMSASVSADVKKLSSDDEYLYAKKYVGEEGISRLHIVPLGIYNAIMYMFGSSGFYEQMPTAEMDKEMQKRLDDTYFSVASVLRTLKSMTMQDSGQGSSSVFFHIEEIPKSDKERADAIFSGLPDSTNDGW